MKQEIINSPPAITEQLHQMQVQALKEMQKLQSQLLEQIGIALLKSLQLLNIETPDSLLLPGRVERLVRQGRAPYKVSDKEGFAGWYQIIPRGSKIEDGNVDQKTGFLVFQFSDDTAVGNVIFLTNSEAKLMDDRVVAEKYRLEQEQIPYDSIE